MNKIPFQNRIFAFILSVLFVVSLFLSFFALPVELVFFNPQSYYSMLDKEEYAEVFPNILSEALVYQADSLSSQVNLGASVDTLNPILTERFSSELVQETFNKVIDQLLAYLNFKIPISDMEININSLKTSLVSDSQDIAIEYVAAFPNCRTTDLEGVDFSASLTVQDLPACKPEGINLSRFEDAWANTFEDVFNKLPSSISLTNVIPLEQNISNQFFNNYSLMRWGFRLLPIISIILLTLIALLLRRQREVMWKWTGRLLVLISGLTLIGLVILMIGFDQFIAILLNPLLKNLITGFGYVLLGIVQDVGFQMLVWVIISALVVMGFGLFLMLAVKFIQPKTSQTSVEDIADSGYEPVGLETAEDLAEVSEKAIQLETLEEIEEKEKKGKKNKNDKDEED